MGVPDAVLDFVILRQHPNATQSPAHQEFKFCRVQRAIGILGDQLAPQFLDHLLGAEAFLVLRR